MLMTITSWITGLDKRLGGIESRISGVDARLGSIEIALQAKGIQVPHVGKEQDMGADGGT